MVALRLPTLAVETPKQIAALHENTAIQQSIIFLPQTLHDTESRWVLQVHHELPDSASRLEYITYEWQTRRYPVSAEVQGDGDGEFTFQAGRSNVISDPAMYTTDREARQRRVSYVRAAVDGRNVRSGDETTIPIPRSDDGVAALLETLRSAATVVDETDLDELETRVNEVVYDMFDISSEQQNVIEDYLETFRVY